MSQRNRVPLPDVPQFTDNIEFTSLGLPVGYDDERLLVNLDAIDRVRKIAGFGQLTVFQTELQDAAIGPIAKDIPNRPALKSIIRYPSGDEYVGPADAVIKIDSFAFHTRINQVKTPHHKFDPKVVGQALDVGFKTALNSASREANVSSEKIKESGLLYGLWMGFQNAAWIPALASANHFSAKADLTKEVLFEIRAMADLPVAVYCLPEAALFLAQMMGKLYKKEAQVAYLTEGIGEKIVNRRKSFFVGAAPDRYVAAAALLRVSTLLRTRA